MTSTDFRIISSQEAIRPLGLISAPDHSRINVMTADTDRMPMNQKAILDLMKRLNPTIIPDIVVLCQ